MPNKAIYVSRYLLEASIVDSSRLVSSQKQTSLSNFT